VDLSTVEGRIEWHRGRKRGIGGSEAATLFNRPDRIVNKWQSRYSLYIEKISDDVTDHDNPVLELGRVLEPVVRETYARKLGRVVREGLTLVAHEDYDFMLANTDGQIAPVPEHDGPGVYEGKTQNVFVKHDWSQEPPLLYRVQLMHYLAVTGLKWGSFGCFELGAYNWFHWGDEERNDKFIEALIEEEWKFWSRHVVPRIPPDPDGSEATTKALKLLHPQDNGRVIFLPPKVTGWLQQRKEIGAAVRLLESRRDEIDNKLRALLGSNSYGAVGAGDEGGIAYKTQAAKTSPDLVLQVVEDLLGKEDADAVRRETKARRGTTRVLRTASEKMISAALAEQQDADA
jgi:putative phage-type endonuclease